MVALACCYRPRGAQGLGRKRFAAQTGMLVFGLTGLCASELLDMNECCCGIVVLKGMFFTNGGVWKAIFCSLTIWFSGGVWKNVGCSPTILYSGDVYKMTGMPLMLSSIGCAILLEITVSCGVCMEAFCAIMVVKKSGPSAVGLHNLFVRAVVIVESPGCDASSVTDVRTGVIIGSNDIIGLKRHVGVPPIPPVTSDAIFEG